MCIIIALNPIKDMITEISQDWLKQSWENNTDGAGFSFIKKDENNKSTLFIMKGFFDYDKFNEAFQRNRELNPESRFLIHMRNTTFGETNVENCHPHSINRYCVMAHNGSIAKMNAKTKEGPSDSALLAVFLSKLNNHFYKNSEYIYLIEKYVGLSNKIAFMGIDNNIYFVNLDKWIPECDNNILLSNDYYKTKRKVYTASEWDSDEYPSYPTYGSYYAYYKGKCDICGHEMMVLRRRDLKDLALCHECYIKTNISDIADICACCKKAKPDVSYSQYKNGTVTIHEHLCFDCYNQKKEKISREDKNPDTVKQDDVKKPEEKSEEKTGEVCYNCKEPLIGNEFLHGYCSKCYQHYCCP